MGRVNRYGGYSLVDVLLLSCVVLLCTAALLPAAIDAEETAKRVDCQRHLAMIGKALILYSNENKGLFPRTHYDSKAKLCFFTHPNPVKADDQNAKAFDPFDKDGPDSNDITAAMFLLIRQEQLPPQIFLCPGSSGEKASYGKDFEHPTPLQIGDDPVYAFAKMTNFPSPKYLDYSFLNIYPTPAAIGEGYKTFITAFASDFAVAADLNPGSKELTKLTPTSPPDQRRAGNSLNHGGDGQNVLYADGHAEFQRTCLCGSNNDNIYTYGKVSDSSGGEGVVGDPATAIDTVLMPSAVEELAAMPKAKPAAP